jgi:hypothetical protein
VTRYRQACRVMAAAVPDAAVGAFLGAPLAAPDAPVRP